MKKKKNYASTYQWVLTAKTNASGLIQYKQYMIAKTGKTHKASYSLYIDAACMNQPIEHIYIGYKTLWQLTLQLY